MKGEDLGRGLIPVARLKPVLPWMAVDNACSSSLLERGRAASFASVDARVAENLPARGGAPPRISESAPSTPGPCPLRQLPSISARAPAAHCGSGPWSSHFLLAARSARLLERLAAGHIPQRGLQDASTVFASAGSSAHSGERHRPRSRSRAGGVGVVGRDTAGCDDGLGASPSQRAASVAGSSSVRLQVATELGVADFPLLGPRLQGGGVGRSRRLPRKRRSTSASRAGVGGVSSRQWRRFRTARRRHLARRAVIRDLEDRRVDDARIAHVLIQRPVGDPLPERGGRLLRGRALQGRDLSSVVKSPRSPR